MSLFVFVFIYIIARYRILGWQFFSLNTINMSLHCTSICPVCDKKIASIKFFCCCFFVFFYLSAFLLWCASYSFIFFLTVCIYVGIYWCPLSFLVLQVQFSSVQLLSHVRLFATLWITARQASLSITISWSSLKLTSIELVMPSSHLILCRPLLLLPPIPPSIRVFSNESTLRMR